MPRSAPGPNTSLPSSSTRPLGRRGQAADDMQQRGLAAAGRADNADQFADADCQRSRLQDGQRAVFGRVLFGQPFQAQNRVRHGIFFRSRKSGGGLELGQYRR